MNDNHLDANRRAALSRARSLANSARSPHNGRLQLQNIAAGDVVDWPDQRLFLAIVRVTQGCLYALGVSQADPSATVRDVRMGAYPLGLRLSNGWLAKVPGLRR
jgi:hypothetical protein